MSSHDEPDGSAIPRKLVFDAQRQVQHARSDFWAELSSSGQVGDDTIERLQWAVLVYYDTLHDHRDHDAVEELWREAGPWKEGLDALPQYVATPDQSTAAATGPRQTDPETTISPRRIDPMILYEISHDLQDIQNALGLGAPAKDTTPEDDADLDDLESILRARGQTEAADRLPERKTGAD